MTVGENIKRIRKEKGLTQRKLGELCGIAESNIRKYENGKQNPKIETIDKISIALGVSITKIKEDISWSEVLTTPSFKAANSESEATEAVVSILAFIYGSAEEKSVFDSNYGETFYWLIGTKDNQFVLYENDILQLLEYYKATTPFLVDKIKDERPENEIIKELIRELHNPEHIAKLKKFEKEHGLT